MTYTGNRMNFQSEIFAWCSFEVPLKEF